MWSCLHAHNLFFSTFLKQKYHKLLWKHILLINFILCGWSLFKSYNHKRKLKYYQFLLIIKWGSWDYVAEFHWALNKQLYSMFYEVDAREFDNSNRPIARVSHSLGSFFLLFLSEKYSLHNITDFSFFSFFFSLFPSFVVPKKQKKKWSNFLVKYI